MTYEPNGDLAAATDSVNGAWSYGYNDLDQLTTANSYAYGYDRYGNRWTATTPGSMAASFSGGSNRIAGASYDASGDLLQANGCAFTYDAEHRLSTISG
ncbi:MAG: hypothetical protein ACRD1A_05455, partial [Terriglobales bacterium]